jgi:Conjugative transposon protein TcpC
MSTPPSMLTNTWRRRLDTGGSTIRKTLAAIAFAACTIVALSTIWGWITDEPLDVDAPARAAVNRTDYVGGYAMNCVRLLLTVTEAQRSALNTCWAPDELRSLPTTPPVVVDSTVIAKIALTATYSDVEQWQVVVRVNQRAYDSATPETTMRQVNVLFSKYGLRTSGLLATVSEGGSGATLPLNYSASLPVGAPDDKGRNRATGNPVSDTVAGFLNSYLTPVGGLERYVAAGSGMSAVSTCQRVLMTGLIATRMVDTGQQAPPDGSTVQVLATVTELTNRYAPQTEQYPLTLTLQSGSWSVTRIDSGPLLNGTAQLTPVAPSPGQPAR